MTKIVSKNHLIKNKSYLIRKSVALIKNKQIYKDKTLIKNRMEAILSL